MFIWGGGGDIQLPEDIIEKRIYGYNPMEFFLSSVSQKGDVRVIDFREIISESAAVRNKELNRHDVVFLEVATTLGLLHMIECAGTGIKVCASVHPEFLGATQDINIYLENDILTVNDDSIEGLKRLFNKEVGRIRSLRKQRADKAYKAFAWVNSPMRIDLNL